VGLEGFDTAVPEIDADGTSLKTQQEPRNLEAAAIRRVYAFIVLVMAYKTGNSSSLSQSPFLCNAFSSILPNENGPPMSGELATANSCGIIAPARKPSRPALTAKENVRHANWSNRARYDRGQQNTIEAPLHNLTRM
jgi:hypothetical protein